MPGIERLAAAGIVGSVARGTAGPHSDVDVFLILPDQMPWDHAFWWRTVNDALEALGRPVSLIPYTLGAVRRIVDWYVLRLASDAVFAWDPDGTVADLFRRVVAKAKAEGFEEVIVGGRPCWKWTGPLTADWKLELDP
ncbi:MAG: nucleotidyltransferase domain-containing protein [Myxococcota bacterium]|nr:nucleotidyltransferase domain-containing protein [Myxococcota bacterium]